MLQERIEPAWLDAFETVLGRCAVGCGDTVAILCESQSRPILPELARLAAARLKAKAFVLQLTSVPTSGMPVIRSTGASTALQQIAAVVQALASSTLVVDCTVEGLMHAPELPAILKAGARVLYVSNEHPEALARLLPDEVTEQRVKEHVKRLRSTRRMLFHPLAARRGHRAAGERACQTPAQHAAHALSPACCQTRSPSSG